MIVGSSQFKYRVIAEWAKLPGGWSFKEVGGVGVNRRDNVYVFNRGEHPMIIFDREGNFLRSWGEGQMRSYFSGDCHQFRHFRKCRKNISPLDPKSRLYYEPTSSHLSRSIFCYIV